MQIRFLVTFALILAMSLGGCKKKPAIESPPSTYSEVEMRTFLASTLVPEINNAANTYPDQKVREAIQHLMKAAGSNVSFVLSRGPGPYTHAMIRLDNGKPSLYVYTPMWIDLKRAADKVNRPEIFSLNIALVLAHEDFHLRHHLYHPKPAEFQARCKWLVTIESEAWWDECQNLNRIALTQVSKTVHVDDGLKEIFKIFRSCRSNMDPQWTEYIVRTRIPEAAYGKP